MSRFHSKSWPTRILASVNLKNDDRDSIHTDIEIFKKYFFVETNYASYLILLN